MSNEYILSRSVWNTLNLVYFNGPCGLRQYDGIAFLVVSHQRYGSEITDKVEVEQSADYTYLGAPAFIKFVVIAGLLGISDYRGFCVGKELIARADAVVAVFPYVGGKPVVGGVRCSL